MRFFLYALFMILWILFWWWRYTCPIKQTCCTPGEQETPARTEVVEIEQQEARPLMFRWSDPKLIASQSIDRITDSLVTSLEDQNDLEITGQFYRDEINETEFSDLGIARASAMKNAFAGKIDTSRVIVRSQLADVRGDVKNKMFEALQF